MRISQKKGSINLSLKGKILLVKSFEHLGSLVTKNKNFTEKEDPFRTDILKLYKLY